MSHTFSPALAHYQRVLAKNRAAEQANSHAASRTQYEKMLLLLDSHQQTLSQIQSLQSKIEAKRQLLPEYQAHLNGLLEAKGSLPQDDVLVTLMVWHLDCGLLAEALPLARCALTNGMVMPERYKRTTGTVVAEQSAECDTGDMPAADRAALLSQALELTRNADMPDEVRAKLHKAIGIAEHDAGQLQAALGSLQAALKLHSGVGVKKDIEKLQREIRQQADAPTA